MASVGTWIVPGLNVWSVILEEIDIYMPVLGFLLCILNKLDETFIIK